MWRLSRLIYKIIGWKIVGVFPNHIKKKMVIVAPHTSNWDFPIGILARSQFKDSINFVGKKALFKPPVGWIMKALGGVAIDRSKSTNFVRSVVNEYNKREKFTIQIAPEGKRGKVEKFKTGYYFIAKMAQIPIVPVVFDWGNKQVIVLDSYFPTEDSEKDLAYIENLYRGYQGKNPENSFT